MDRFQQALATARQASDPRTEGMSLTWLGEVHERLGSFETAIGLRKQAVTALERGRNKWQYAYVLQKLAGVHHRHGRSSEAIGNYQQAQAIFRQIGDRRTQADVLFQLGHTQKTTGQNEAARQSWQQALAIFEELRDTRANRVRAVLTAEAATNPEPDKPHHHH
jgi:tetratricopeptide (TPR) repeat protein